MNDFLMTAAVADLNDRIRIECLWDGKDRYSFPSLTIHTIDRKEELFYADNSDWIKNELLNSLVYKKASDEDVEECFRILKQEGIKKKILKQVIRKVIELKMI